MVEEDVAKELELAEEEELRHFNTFDSARAPSLTLFSSFQRTGLWSLIAQEKKCTMQWCV